MLFLLQTASISSDIAVEVLDQVCRKRDMCLGRIGEFKNVQNLNIQHSCNCPLYFIVPLRPRR